ncbi:SRPBCC family protein [Gellertiella hungarica]|uniref:Uncharacterized protein YndB with AHSA1/START domain n=1 Tax=Gellertiella hungarica TaxID=1572859 RepID=A0A7W6NIJ4_9HYPH|nr:SRPBCC family protein [Gellertiella hungarica]MBB4063440.1 uncharacterized protein YndB with AHSA1/START domain [Gellertiella hungarica]
MWKALKYAVALLFVAAVLVVGFASLQPDTFSVVRQTTIQATPEEIYPLLVNFREWARWSPWEKLDPNLQRQFSGPEEGVGAAYAWEGNDDVGAGSMEIREAVPWSRVSIRLKFKRPMEADNTIVFMLTPRDGATDIEWAMTGNQPLVGKIFGLFFNIDRIVGRDFEKGLATLKAEAEKS